MEYKSAGILFYETQTGMILSGFHPKKNRWSGFGGHKHDGETPAETAVREVCEELFGAEVPQEILAELIAQLPLEQKVQRGSYILFTCPMNTVFLMGSFLQQNHVRSAFYDEYPGTLFQLLENRSYAKNTEVESLTLFSKGELEDIKLILTNEFYKDLLNEFSCG